MNDVWFISDTHFGHVNILEYERDARPFENIHHMNETIIENWNKVVKPNDTVYHLGDFCFGRGNIQLAGRLQGKKRLVMGNHDTYPSSEYLQHFDKLYGVKHWERCILSHMPVHPAQLGSRWLLNVHGHLHSRVVQEKFFPEFSKQGFPADMNYFNVSVENHNLTPVHADIIRDRCKQLD